MRVVCPGSFDPVTNGHLDIIRRSHDLFGEVVVAIGRNSTKPNSMFSLDERLDLVRAATSDMPGVEVAVIDGLLVDFCRAHGASAVVKGLRFAGDFDYELQMSHLNRAAGDVETILLPAGTEYGTIASSMLRELVKFGGDISPWVPAAVWDAVRAKRG